MRDSNVEIFNTDKPQVLIAMSAYSLGVEELRNIDEGEKLVVELHNDEPYNIGEGTVKSVSERRDGGITISMLPFNGPQHTCKLVVPSDGRKNMKFSGVARNATKMDVAAVTKRY